MPLRLTAPGKPDSAPECPLRTAGPPSHCAPSGGELQLPPQPGATWGRSSQAQEQRGWRLFRARSAGALSETADLETENGESSLVFQAALTATQERGPRAQFPDTRSNRGQSSTCISGRPRRCAILAARAGNHCTHYGRQREGPMHMGDRAPESERRVPGRRRCGARGIRVTEYGAGSRRTPPGGAAGGEARPGVRQGGATHPEEPGAGPWRSAEGQQEDQHDVDEDQERQHGEDHHALSARRQVAAQHRTQGTPGGRGAMPGLRDPGHCAGPPLGTGDPAAQGHERAGPGAPRGGGAAVRPAGFFCAAQPARARQGSQPEPRTEAGRAGDGNSSEPGALTWVTPWEAQGTGRARCTEGGSRVPWGLADTRGPEPRGWAKASDSWTKNCQRPRLRRGLTAALTGRGTGHRTPRRDRAVGPGFALRADGGAPGGCDSGPPHGRCPSGHHFVLEGKQLAPSAADPPPPPPPPPVSLRSN